MKHNTLPLVSRNILAVALIQGCWIISSASAQTAPLTPGDRIPLPGVTGGFDFIRFDASQDRLLMGHEGNHTFDVFDVNAGKLLKVVPTGTSQDAQIDTKNHNYYVSGNDPGRMVIVDAKTLAISGEMPMPADTDIGGFDPDTGLVHLCNDTAAQQWLIDPLQKKIVGTINFDGKGLEDMAFDLKNRRMYQAVKGSNTIGVVDLSSNTVIASWPLAPDTGPHGIARAPEFDTLLVACAGKLVMLDCASGKIVSTAPIAQRVDEMAYDPGLHRAYCSGRTGKISIIQVAADKLTPLGDVPDQPRTGDITVDLKTHTVWVGCFDGTNCFVQSFTPNQ